MVARINKRVNAVKVCYYRFSVASVTCDLTRLKIAVNFDLYWPNYMSRF